MMMKDSVRPLSQAGLYIVFGILPIGLFSGLATFAFNQLVGSVILILVSALLANLICLRIFKHVGLTHIAMPLNRAGLFNVLAGGVLGCIAAAAVVVIPLALGQTHFIPSIDAQTNVRTQSFVPLVLLAGAAGEEIMFRGFGFQILLRAFGPFSAILPIGVLFGLIHAANPHASPIGIVNTAGFGMLFGFAFVRTHDIWFPLGLHAAWNLTLLFFGARISGITIRITAYELASGSAPIWTGGAYGPEESLLTTLAIIALLILIAKIPVRKQIAFLVDLDNSDLQAVEAA